MFSLKKLARKGLSVVGMEAKGSDYEYIDRLGKYIEA